MATISPKVFTVEGKATVKHDDFLLYIYKINGEVIE
jgi:hypothetical protein